MIIWLLTWNCENQFPANNTLAYLKNSLFPANLPVAQMPDLFIIGLQEAKPAASNLVSFVSHRLAAQAIPGVNYRSISSASVSGATKLTGGTCYIQLGVLVRDGNDLDVQHDPQSNLTAPQLTALQNTANGQGNRLLVDRGATQYKHGSTGCKGGAYAKVFYQGRRLGFINAHLTGPQSAAKTNAQIDQLLNRITNGIGAPNAVAINQALNQQFDVVFFMGDLNYRLSAANVNPNVTQMVANLRTRGGRNGLWPFDTLPNSPLVQTYQFTFPQLSPDALPTYKRYYKDRTAQNPCLQLATNVAAATGVPGFQGDYTAQSQLIQDCYFHGKPVTAPVASATRQGYLEVGWLDRIGYKVSPNANPAIVVPALIPMDTFDGMVLSDHVPVLMKITI